MNRIKGETGAENAERFVRMVKAEAKEERHIIAYMTPGSSHRSGWEWMANKEWRSIVHRRLQEEGVTWEPKFSPPDSLDSWTFYATARHPRPKAEFTPIGETLDPATTPVGRVVSRVPRPILAGAWLALILVSMVFLLYSCDRPARAVSLPPPLHSENADG